MRFVADPVDHCRRAAGGQAEKGSVTLRHEKSEQWVEIHGAADVPIALSNDMQRGGPALQQAVKRVVMGCDFADWGGAEIDPRVEVMALSRRQLTWLRKQIQTAVLAEELDPEA